MNIKLHFQPTGNSCGPTCLYMALEYFENGVNDLPFDTVIPYTIEDIYKMCGTDWVVGTPPDRMEIGMKALNFKYIEHMCSPRPFELLKQVIKDGHVPIIRTITKGVPHWIIVSGLNFVYEDKFNVLDPWQGKIQYTEKELDAVWSPRQYQFFEVIKQEYNITNVEKDYTLKIKTDDN